MSGSIKKERMKLGNALLRDYAKEDLQHNQPALSVELDAAPVGPKGPGDNLGTNTSDTGVDEVRDNSETGVGLSKLHGEMRRSRIIEADKPNPRHLYTGQPGSSPRSNVPNNAQYSHQRYSYPVLPAQYYSPQFEYEHCPPPRYSTADVIPSVYVVPQNPPNYYVGPMYHYTAIPSSHHYSRPGVLGTLPPMAHVGESNVYPHVPQVWTTQQHHQTHDRRYDSLPNPSMPTCPQYLIQRSPIAYGAHDPYRQGPDRTRPGQTMQHPQASPCPGGYDIGGGDLDKKKNRRKAGKTGKGKNLVQLGNIQGRVYSLSCRRDESRALQELITTNDDIRNLVYTELLPNFPESMRHPFSNYLFQKLFKYSPDVVQIQMLETVRDHFHSCCKDKYGSRAVQEIIMDCTNKPNHAQIVFDALEKDIPSLCMDENGNHVIQHCIRHFSPVQTDRMFDAVISNCIFICEGKFGNRVVQTCIECGQHEKRNVIVDLVLAHASELMEDQYGNYVIQSVLNECPDSINSLCNVVDGHVTAFATQKHASMVMEKCIVLGSLDFKRRYVLEMIQSPNLLKLIHDEFGNYVLQSALKSLPSELHSLLASKLKDCLPEIQATAWGLQIIAKICSQPTESFNATHNPENPEI